MAGRCQLCNGYGKKIVQNHDGIAVILTAISTIFGVFWAIFIWQKGKSGVAKEPDASTASAAQMNVGISMLEFEAAMQRQESRLRAELLTISSAHSSKRNELQSRLDETQTRLANLQEEYVSYKKRFEVALLTLNELRREIVPSQVDSDIFPPGLKVLSFVKGQHLKLQMTGIPVAVRISILIFGVFWAGGCAVGLHQSGVAWPFAAIFFLVVLYFGFFRAPSIKFNFVKRKITFAGAGGISIAESLPIMVDVKKMKDGWRAYLRVGSRQFAAFPSRTTEEEAFSQIAPFAKALNWQMGLPLLMGNGLTLAQPLG